MTKAVFDRREFARLATACGAALALPGHGRAATRDEIIEAAQKESGLVWYDHYDRDAAEAILAAFKKTYPFVKKPEFVDTPSAQKTAKITQESTAGGPTADVLLNDAVVQQQLWERGFLLEADWGALGVPVSPTTTPTKYMLMALTPPYVVLSNNDQVKQTDIPRTWDDAVSEKWRGKTGHWMRASFFVGLLPALGEDKARDLVTKLAALKPRLFDGQFPLAQAIGSGEIAQGIVAYDSAIRIVEKGAPVTMTSIEPSTLSTICGSVLKHGRNPNTARLFLAWLATPEGAIKFESETKRGNYFVEGTATRKLLAGQKVSYHQPADAIAQSKKLNGLEVEFSRRLAGR
jgi:iron(III) transport system substrate-binding protein